MRLVAEGLGCTRGARRLFDGLGFTLEAGRALIVTGPNGSGKSSLLRILAGLVSADAGTIRLEFEPDDLATARDAEASRAELTHYLGHLDAQKAALTVAENLAFWRRMLGHPAARPDDALERVGLGPLARLPVAVLSAGQKRRLSLARLLVADRPLWLLDEPTAALDVAGQELVGTLARAHLDKGGLIVAATHAPLDFGPADALRIGPAAVPPAAQPAVSA
ncbi:heme ABC exporter ATP-binding protein CcmA [Bosea sp. 117]|uniref:heme ABC exporter ATP-binding protein CcmA n=1 Tax=Bosea sp. 117 TaxID=1125973 RepID=UPI000493EDAB|nr:heme ABC exporter ATP-binding protein CcmA [Bosea sp. 117]